VAFWAAPLVRADAPNVEEPLNAVCSVMAILRRIGSPEGLRRLGRFRGGGRLYDQLGGWLCGLGLTPPRLAVPFLARPAGQNGSSRRLIGVKFIKPSKPIQQSPPAKPTQKLKPEIPKVKSANRRY